MDKKVKVEYKTQQDHCNCCGHKLEKPKTSKTREFYISKDDCFAWLDEESWETEAEDNDELTRIVDEFICDTIDFFATNSHEVILIDKSEIEKVKQFILEEVVS